jgi:murein DD-endopeptidase MepM/ murein hydrolase activator NlpD
MSGATRWLNRALGRLVPEKRLFLQSPTSHRYLRLTPLTQLAFGGLALLALAWLSFATATVGLKTLYADGAESQALVLSEAYRARLDALTAERDQRAAEAYSAQNRFQIAMEEIGRQQSAILEAVEGQRELAAGLDLMRDRLREMVAERDLARAEASLLQEQAAALSETRTANGASDLADTLTAVTAALSNAVRVRDGALAERDALAAARATLEAEVEALAERQEAMLAEFEYAARMALEPLEAMFEATELDVDSMLAAVRRDHSGIGGGTVRVSTRSFGSDADIDRFDDLMIDLDRVNMLRIAAARVPYTMPVRATHRFTSGFGVRRDPKTGGRRMHAGIDLAAPRGTPIYATADGVVASAGAERGYGNTVRIRHDFGFETVYAHKTKIHVAVGQQVSRGDHIGDMGATGRATGVHLHYEVHLNGRPMNPMVYLEAARDVF